MCTYSAFSVFFSKATSVTQVTIINPPPYVVDGDQNVELQYTVTLSSTIGPDYSALSIHWTRGVDTIINNCSSPQPHGNTQISDTFSCNLTLATISATSAGLYTCNAAVTGISGGSTDLITLQVQGLEINVLVNQDIMYFISTQDLSRVLISSHQRMLFLDSRLCSLVKCTLHYQSLPTCSQSSGSTEGVWSLVMVGLY